MAQATANATRRMVISPSPTRPRRRDRQRLTMVIA
jgi:hypothetical protein